MRFERDHFAVVIGISGASRCGKGTLSGNLKTEIRKRTGLRVAVVGQDAFATLQSRRCPEASPRGARWEYTDSIDFHAFVADVRHQCSRNDVVIVEGFRAFHESGIPFAGSRSLNGSMHLRIWLEVSRETCYERRMATTRVSRALFNQALWPCHESYREEVFDSPDRGLSPPLVIDGENSPESIVRDGLPHVLSLLSRHGISQRCADRMPP